jgi:isoleucyl-tRNA synthetase
VNDKEGKKMSKSKGNVTSPLDLMKNSGAEILRLWVVLEDYRNDVSFSTESLERVSESYRKIRNTIRFLLGNLSDFDPEKDRVPREKLGDLDRWAMSRAAEVIGKIHLAYETYEYHSVYHAIVNFCAVDLSALYFDILKDRLYTAGKTSQERRSSQTAMWIIASSLLRALAPILSFTAEEAWGFLNHGGQKRDSIFLSSFPAGKEGLDSWRDLALEERFQPVWAVREQVLKALEEARQAKTIGHPREARVVLTVDPAAKTALSATREDPARLFLVSELEIKPGLKVEALISRATGAKCARCWQYKQEVGKNSAHPDLCERCIEAIQ